MQKLLRDEAREIWLAGVHAVRGDRLIRTHVAVQNQRLIVGSHRWPLAEIDRICVVGAGKAGASMAQGLEQALGHSVIEAKQLSGWVNVPADCVRPLRRIQLHAARPAGVNEPTRTGQVGAQEILRRVAELHERDLCLCLLSGGGSALMPAPRPGVTLDQKLQITRHLSAAGANIQQLNAVRRQLSMIKGGGLARACTAGRLVSLIISDVLGDPLDVIASGPTVIPPDAAQAARDALHVLEQFQAARAGIDPDLLTVIAQQAAPPTSLSLSWPTDVLNLVIGNNQVACEAAAAEARRRGYDVQLLEPESPTTPAEDVGRRLASELLRRAKNPTAVRPRTKTGTCLISGGEPVVRLVDTSQRGLGGRNQQLVLAALQVLLTDCALPPPLHQQVLLSGGTDGEDGPTDAAGAVIDAALVQRVRQLQLDPADYLHRNDAYHFFAAADGLLKTGPTHTNVCDLRVVLTP